MSPEVESRCRSAAAVRTLEQSTPGRGKTTRAAERSRPPWLTRGKSALLVGVPRSEDDLSTVPVDLVGMTSANLIQHQFSADQRNHGFALGVHEEVVAFDDMSSAATTRHVCPTAHEIRRHHSVVLSCKRSDRNLNAIDRFVRVAFLERKICAQNWQQESDQPALASTTSCK